MYSTLVYTWKNVLENTPETLACSVNLISCSLHETCVSTIDLKNTHRIMFVLIRGVCLMCKIQDANINGRQ